MRINLDPPRTLTWIQITALAGRELVLNTNPIIIRGVVGSIIVLILISTKASQLLTPHHTPFY
jgi:hypothetical protein